LRSEPTPKGAKKNQQSICNGKSTPTAMQDIVTAREKPPTQEQWETTKRTTENNEKNNGKQSEILANTRVWLCGDKLMDGRGAARRNAKRPAA
jgi:hypothetical protein